MKLITLNTWVGVLNEDLLKFVQKYADDTDVFCFQEIYFEAEGKTSEASLKANLNIHTDIANLLPNHAGYFRPSHKDYFGQSIFVKKNLKIVNEGDILIYKNLGTNPAMGTHSRNANFVEIERNNKKYLILNVHGLWNGQGKTDTPDRILQSQNIKNFVDNYAGPKVICGDFNLQPDTESLKIVSEGLRDLIAEYGITSTRTSHYAKPGKFADYIFTSLDVEVNNFKVLPEEVSDHAALFLEFK